MFYWYLLLIVFLQTIETGADFSAPKLKAAINNLPLSLISCVFYINKVSGCAFVTIRVKGSSIPVNPVVTCISYPQSGFYIDIAYDIGEI
jgi:hypothetical protein